MKAPTSGTPLDLVAPADRDYFSQFGPGLVAVLPPQRPGPGGWGRGGPPHGGAWIHLGHEGRARAFTGKVDVGQGTRTALTLIVAEELGLPASAVEVTMGDTDLCPWDMGTFGSRSMPDAQEHLRLTAAAARHALLDIAAKRLGVPPGQVVLSGGKARLGTEGSAITYGDLVKDLRQVATVSPATVPRSPSEWTVAGRTSQGVGGRAIVTGAQRYTSDLHLEGLWHGMVLSPPSYGATLRTVDTSRAQALPGVKVVQDGDFVGVVAPDLLTARTAHRALKATWNTTPQPDESTIVDYLRSHPSKGDAWDVAKVEVGNVPQALGRTPVTLHETYTTAYIAHVPMETHAVMAAWEGERLTVWIGTQVPFRARESLAEDLHLPASRIRVIVPPTGGGFGGKHATELASAAARLARASGHPVKITYSREQEFTLASFRPLSVIKVDAGADQNGGLVAWQFHNLNGGAAGIRPPYRVPNQNITNTLSDSPLPQSPYRAIGATANNFARESAMDELAARVGADALEYRLRHLADERVAAVLKAVAEHVHWAPRSTPSKAGNGRGIAVGVEKGGRVATYVEVNVGEDRRLSITRIVTGYECGTIVNPVGLRGQVEGGTMMALGGALFEAIHFENGRILNPRLSEYRVPRFRDVPPLEVILLDRPDLPSQGAGETPLIALAPAIANAIFDATGTRLRSLPLVPDGLVP